MSNIKKIVDLVNDKLTSDMGARKIADIINKELEENNVRILIDNQKRGKIL